MLELATTSVVYREKVAACELLDAAIKLAIGQTNTEVKKARNVAEVKKLARGWSSHYACLFPAMLQLATDVESFARSIFEPLTLQTIHWLTSDPQLRLAQPAPMVHVTLVLCRCRALPNVQQ